MQQYPPQTYTRPPPHVSSKPMWTTKLVIRLLQILFDLVILAVSAHMATTWDASPIILVGPPAALSLCWCLAEAICLCVRAGHRGIHPGANVGLDLILWLAFAATTVINGLVGFGGSDYYDYYTDETGLFTSGRVVIALGALETIMHLGLFVVACYETHLRNSKPPVIYYQAAPQPTMNQQTYYQPHQQQHSQQQPPPQTMMELPGNQPMGYPSHIYSQNNYYEKPGSDVHTHLYEPSAPSHPGSPAPPSMTDYSSELAAPSTKYR